VTAGTATARRVRKLEEALGPTQLLVRWLTQAQHEYPSFAAYTSHSNATAGANPMLWLPEPVARWVRTRTRGQHERVVDQAIDRVVTATLGCVALVREMNHAIAWNQHTDVITLDFLEATSALIATDQADAKLRSLWTSHLGRLLQQTATWELAAYQVAERYLAGNDPLFAAEAAHLASVQGRCQPLPAAVAPQQPRRRGRAAPIVYRAAIASAASTDANDLVARLLARGPSRGGTGVRRTPWPHLRPAAHRRDEACGGGPVSSATEKRLDKIEASLTPQAAFLVWLAEAHEHPTMTAHATALKDAPDTSFPLYRLPDQVEQAVRLAHKGEKPEVINRAERRAVKDVVLLYYLHSETNLRLMADWRAICLQVALATSHLGHLFRADTPDAKDLTLGRQLTGIGLTELLEWDAAVRTLAARYFGGQTPLYPAWATQLTAMVAEAEQIAELCNDHLEWLAFLAEDAKPTRNAKRGSATPPAEVIALDALQVQAEAGGRELTRHIVAMAKAEALRFMGESRQAYALVRARLWPEAD
jgi:hypothetical protein